jgi:hypothetical protein
MVIAKNPHRKRSPSEVLMKVTRLEVGDSSSFPGINKPLKGSIARPGDLDYLAAHAMADTLSNTVSRQDRTSRFSNVASRSSTKGKINPGLHDL